MKHSRSQERTRRSLKLSDVLRGVTAPLLDGKDITAGRLLMEWPAVVGDKIAAVTAPVKCARRKDSAVLHVAVSAAHALEIQHMEPFILERISCYFGYQAVTKLQLSQMAEDDMDVAPSMEKDRMAPRRNMPSSEWVKGADRLNKALNDLSAVSH